MENTKQVRKQRKKRLPALDRYVIFSLSAIIIFTIIAIVYQFITENSLSDALIVAFYGVFGGELLMLCLIKRLKLKEKDKEDLE
jgi:hypothetical protein